MRLVARRLALRHRAHVAHLAGDEVEQGADRRLTLRARQAVRACRRVRVLNGDGGLRVLRAEFSPGFAVGLRLEDKAKAGNEGGLRTGGRGERIGEQAEESAARVRSSKAENTVGVPARFADVFRRRFLLRRRGCRWKGGWQQPEAAVSAADGVVDREWAFDAVRLDNGVKRQPQPRMEPRGRSPRHERILAGFRRIEPLADRSRFRVLDRKARTNAKCPTIERGGVERDHVPEAGDGLGRRRFRANPVEQGRGVARPERFEQNRAKTIGGVRPPRRLEGRTGAQDAGVAPDPFDVRRPEPPERRNDHRERVAVANDEEFHLRAVVPHPGDAGVDPVKTVRFARREVRDEDFLVAKKGTEADSRNVVFRFAVAHRRREEASAERNRPVSAPRKRVPPCRIHERGKPFDRPRVDGPDEFPAEPIELFRKRGIDDREVRQIWIARNARKHQVLRPRALPHERRGAVQDLVERLPHQPTVFEILDVEFVPGLR